MSYPRVDAASLPAVDEAAMREVDQRMVDKVGIDLPRMMENAGRNLAEAAVSLFAPRRAVVLYGSGGNGGGALVAARHLSNRGVAVDIVASGSTLTPVPAQQHRILAAMGVLDRTDTPRVKPGTLLVDGMIGYSLRGTPTGRAAELIEWVNGQDAPVLSLDVPSGFSADEAELTDVHVQATATVTLALPKEGLVGCAAAGRLLLGDISVPRVVYRDMDLDVPSSLFAHGPLVELV